jgi:hypothetical protein
MAIMPAKKKQDIITFKVDESLAEALSDMPNRSEFIRMAVQAALDGICPVCRGKGVLSPDQSASWESFMKENKLEHCVECAALRLIGSGKELNNNED